MRPSDSEPTLEDVLDSFTVEPDAGRATLEKYLRIYPQFAGELIDLSRELSREIVEDTAPLSARDISQIDAALSRHLESAPAPAVDPLATLSVAELRAFSQLLDIPRQMVTALRERKVDVGSIPRRFLERCAAALKVNVAEIVEAWSLPPSPQLARSFKADVKPTSGKRATFEQVLVEAGVPEDKRTKLLEG